MDETKSAAEALNLKTGKEAESPKQKLEEKVTALAKTDYSLKEIAIISEEIYKSRLFADLQNKEQAYAKIIAGRELGLGPMTSLALIYVVHGRTALEAELMGGLVKQTEKYNYRFKKMTNEECVIDFYENGKLAGTSTFTIDDARRAELTNKDNWKKYPRNMLIARALANGARWFCPDAIHGAYTYDEMGLEVDAEGRVINALPAMPAIEIKGLTPQEPAKGGKAETPQTPLKITPQNKREEIIEKLMAKYGKKFLKEIKEAKKITGKIIDLTEQDFRGFLAEVKKEGASGNQKRT